MLRNYGTSLDPSRGTHRPCEKRPNPVWPRHAGIEHIVALPARSSCHLAEPFDLANSNRLTSEGLAIAEQFAGQDVGRRALVPSVCIPVRQFVRRTMSPPRASSGCAAQSSRPLPIDRKVLPSHGKEDRTRRWQRQGMWRGLPHPISCVHILPALFSSSRPVSESLFLSCLP